MLTAQLRDMYTVSQAAFNYRDAGLSVIPIQTNGSKRPVAAWKTFQSRFPNDSELELFQSCGIAIVAGTVSGNLEIIDFDFKPKYHDTIMW